MLDRLARHLTPAGRFSSSLACRFHAQESAKNQLETAAVGGRRVCYFDDGIIAQEVTEWRRPSFMALRVTESTLPGRHWLTFSDASYEFTAEGAQTRIVRHKTIGTRLYSTMVLASARTMGRHLRA